MEIKVTLCNSDGCTLAGSDGHIHISRPSDVLEYRRRFRKNFLWKFIYWTHYYEDGNPANIKPISQSQRKYFEPDRIDGYRKIPKMTRYGYHCIRCYTPWGFCPTYRHEKTGKLIYFHEGKFCVGPEVLRDLTENWIPVGESENRFYELEMRTLLGTIYATE